MDNSGRADGLRGDRRGGCVRPFHDMHDVNAGGPHGLRNAVADIDVGQWTFSGPAAGGHTGAGLPHPDNPNCAASRKRRPEGRGWLPQPMRKFQLRNYAKKSYCRPHVPGENRGASPRICFAVGMGRPAHGARALVLPRATSTSPHGRSNRSIPVTNLPYALNANVTWKLPQRSTEPLRAHVADCSPGRLQGTCRRFGIPAGVSHDRFDRAVGEIQTVDHFPAREKRRLAVVAWIAPDDWSANNPPTASTPAKCTSPR